MNHHPVIIITSHPEGMTKAVKHLEVEGYEVKVLDSLSANLLDFFGALASTDPEQFQPITDNPDASLPDDEPLPSDPNSADEGEELDADLSNPIDQTQANDPMADEDTDATEVNSNPVYQGTIDDEPIEIHEVPGSDIILHAKTVTGTGDKVKFTLSESVEMNLWEEANNSSEKLHEVSVHLVIEDLNIDKTLKIKVSDMTMDPPVILMGDEWYANFISDNRKSKICH